MEGTEKDEDRLTLDIMEKYGWWNVRGGKWCKVDMQTCPKQLLERQNVKMPSEIKRVGTSSKPTSTSSFSNCCFRCGRADHYSNTCFAKTTVDGDIIHEEDIRKAKTSTPPKPTGKRVGNFSKPPPTSSLSNGCSRCGRANHYASTCFAETNVDGYVIHEGEIRRAITSTPTTTTGKRKFREGCCYKCGRTGHFSPDCYASTDVDGKYI